MNDHHSTSFTPVVQRAPIKGPESSQPSVAEVAGLALVLVVVGGILMSSFYPRRVSLVVPGSLAVVAVTLVLANAVTTVRSGYLRRRLFLSVFRWALLAYFVSAGMLEFVFVFDGTRGLSLVVISAMLLVLAVDVPTIIAFTVGRYSAG